MATERENSLGAKLKRAQDLIAYLNGFSNYNPPRIEDSLAELTNLTESIVSANASADSQLETYRLLVNDRQVIFNDADGSIQKLLTLIRGAVEAQFGKEAKQTVIIGGLIRNMRNPKISKSPLDPLDSTGISKSQKSFGSTVQQFSHVISALQNFNGYNPSNTDLTIAALQQKLQEARDSNHVVAASVQQLQANRAERTALYEDLKQRTQRVKSYIKSEYGIRSPEFKLVRGLSI